MPLEEYTGIFTVTFHKVYETLPITPKAKGREITFEGTLHATHEGGFQIEYSPEGMYHGKIDLGSHLIESIKDVEGNTLWKNPHTVH